MYNLISFIGLFTLVGVAFLCSADRRNMNWRVIGWGLGLQILFALAIFRISGVDTALLWLSRAVTKALGAANEGVSFVFGSLTDVGSHGVILGIQVLPTIIFFSALVSVLYYFGIMQILIRGFAYVFTRLMRISGAESLCAASNIFVGVESTLTVKPHLDEMTKSELCTVLTAGMATVASTVLGAYVFMLKDEFPNIAAHLISASILSAPAALAMSKVVMPEGENPKTLGESVEIHYERESNIFEAIINGANSGLKLIGGVIALLIAVLGLVALVDIVLGAVGGWVNVELSVKGLLGYVFYPFTVMLGVPIEDVPEVARLIGQRAVETEFSAYPALAALLREGSLVHPERSATIAAYALCGFAHLASVGIFVGGVAAIAPKKIKVLSEVAFRALLAATLACLMTACVAGMFFHSDSILFGG